MEIKPEISQRGRPRASRSLSLRQTNVDVRESLLQFSEKKLTLLQEANKVDSFDKDLLMASEIYRLFENKGDPSK